ncbi:TIGR02466 family protein [Asticcacaulis machinosus]|uniref:TIGR02466 family protein n=1 Tax=Asticcacaulis machinosus TaxID=2984211 RepID=A0ABT5HHY1_9CAUL|nr:TIGR02466 family protein [Asticcacaulis machinosus]MDC7675608.1 TIGR02466 family protein [Asticcacaulis machinosus]
MKTPSPATITPLFVTEIYRADLSGSAGFETFIEEIDDTCRAFADDDEAGHDWCEKNAYPGYTSYGSMSNLTQYAPVFADLKKQLDTHVHAFAEVLEYDLGGKKLKLDNIWINILEPGGFHSGHIHPHSVISGTFYVAVPDKASALKFEDPRLMGFMNAPPRKTPHRRDHEIFAYEAPAAGTILMWESWLRHEVTMNQSDDVRISVSFNYGF